MTFDCGITLFLLGTGNAYYRVACQKGGVTFILKKK